MLRVYGVDVLDPAVSLRRVHVLVSRLPPGSVPAAESDAAWSVEAHMLASVFDAVHNLIWITLKANGAKGAVQPKPIPRPGGPVRRGPAAGRKVAWTELADALRAEGALLGG